MTDREEQNTRCISLFPTRPLPKDESSDFLSVSALFVITRGSDLGNNDWIKSITLIDSQ